MQFQINIVNADVAKTEVNEIKLPKSSVSSFVKEIYESLPISYEQNNDEVLSDSSNLNFPFNSCFVKLT